MGEKFSLKDHLFNKDKVVHLANLIHGVYADFATDIFIKDVVREFPHLELKERIVHIREMLYAHLPSDYETALDILLSSLPQELDPNKSDDDFGDFIYAPLSDFVAVYGCTEEYIDKSLSALEEMTKRFSCEDAIRYFLNSFPKKTMQQLQQWSRHKNYHVRRLASEGSRPLLPWSQRVHLDNTVVIERILDNLFSDKTRYVVRSVANHLNDISKQDPQLVVDTLIRWQRENKKHHRQTEKEMQYLSRHSLRTLMKQGYTQAMEFLGYRREHGVTIENLKIQKRTLAMGEPLNFSFDVTASENVQVLIDYTMYFAAKSTKLRSKVYRLKDINLKAGEPLTLHKRHPLRANMSTIALYPGKHRITLQINGVESESREFSIA